MPIDDYTLPPVKRQILIRKGLGRWLSIIDRLLERFAGIKQIIERIEEDDPMAVMVTIINAVCAMKNTHAAGAYLKQRLAHLPLFHYRATGPGEPWDPLEESLEAFKARGRPGFWEDPTPYLEPSVVEAWLDQPLRLPHRP